MISVIIPVYNSENYLFVNLNSILKQTYSDFEVICIDDCSTDSSVEILEYFSKKDERIIVVKNIENKGVSFSRNLGLKRAKGDYIFFMDSDDWISPNTLEKLFTNAKSNDSDLVFYKLVRFQKKNFILDKPAFDFTNSFDKNVDFKKFTFTYEDIKYNVLNTSFAPYLKLYKKSFLNQYDDLIFPENLIYEDIVFHVKSILRASKISFVPNFLYVYNLDNETSLMRDDSKIFDIFKIIDMIEDFLRTENFFNKFEMEFYAFKIVQILQYLNKSHNENYFNIAKEKFEELNLIFTNDMKKKLKDNIYNWNNYLNVLNSNSIQEYLENNRN